MEVVEASEQEKVDMLPIVELSEQTMEAATNEDWPTTDRLLRKIYDEYDFTGVCISMQVWVSMLNIHAVGEERAGDITIFRPMCVDPETGAIVTDPNPTARWLQKIIMTRTNDDADGFGEALDELRDLSGEEYGHRWMSLLRSIAHTIRVLPCEHATIGLDGW